jgi:hypothetical protein
MEAKIIFFERHFHAGALRNFSLVLLPMVSALCFWHAFEGRRPLLGRSEIHTSIFLGALSLLVAALLTFLGLGYPHRAIQFPFALLFYASSSFYFHKAAQERRSGQA